MEQRGCFGTKEYSNTSGICRNCPDYEPCSKVEPKKNGTKKNRRQYHYYCKNCGARDVTWFLLKKDFNRAVDPIGKCNDCKKLIKLDNRSRRI